MGPHHPLEVSSGKQLNGRSWIAARFIKDQIRINTQTLCVDKRRGHCEEHESDWLNIQGTKTGAVVDFGGYRG